MARHIFKLLQDHAFGEHLRENNWFFVLRGVKHVQWNTGATKLPQQFCDHGIAVGPIRFQFHNPMALERLSYGLGFEHTGFVEFAGKTPRGSEIDKDSAALLKFAL